MPRKSKLTAGKISTLKTLIIAGQPAENAAAAVGIPKTSFYRYLKIGRDEIERIERGGKSTPGKKQHADLAMAVEESRAAWEASMLRVIADAAIGASGQPPNWTSAAWLLERRNPAKYGRSDKEAALAREEKQTESKGAFGKAIASLVEDGDPLPINK